jgi:sensor domain CHASE-containing protein
MVKALQRWLDSHQLPAIIAAVLGVVMTISVTMVAIGYLVARP